MQNGRRYTPSTCKALIVYQFLSILGTFQLFKSCNVINLDKVHDSHAGSAERSQMWNGLTLTRENEFLATSQGRSQDYSRGGSVCGNFANHTHF